MNNVKLFQLLSGELLLGEEIEDTIGLKTSIKNPLRVMVMPGNNNKANIAFAPFCEFTKDTIFEFDNSHIVCRMNPIQQFLNEYQRNFGSIMTPSKPTLIVPGA